MSDPALLLQMLGLLLVIGAFAGVLAGLLGVGGGIVLVPAYFYAFQTLGFESSQLMQICVATSLATIIATSARSVHSHNKKGSVDWSVLRGWAPGIMLGACAGMLVVAQLRTATLQFIFGGLAMTIGLYMAFGRSSWRLGSAMPGGVLRAALSLTVGFLSVLMGVGGGSFGVPLMSLYNTAIHRAVATAAGFGLLIAVPAVLGFLVTPVAADIRPPATIGSVNVIAFAITISMTLVTTPLGARIAHALDPRPLKRVFAVFLLLVAANMMRKAAGW
ncbi:sulfite exporter TauE/SafE family protein [Roseobacter sp. YSTF-M11]|uniref:Probable membrane transporter protein n=1 Tax=Roseobacter insulae TaxID=2859783 RepID=A0A9X1FUZ1_9RHOB|nr:sulfite exporter TauE/SafE family protein [Roseobacter insulae]MBW4708440.1 sulfite exporter TauE/SafE family protein [Roseobacter insulae]